MLKRRNLCHSLRKRNQTQSLLSSNGSLDGRSQFTIFWGLENVRSFCLCYYILSVLRLLKFSFSPDNLAADLMLWRNKKISASFITGATLIWVLFEWLNYHFLTLLCFAVVLGMIAQFVWSNASGVFSR